MSTSNRATKLTKTYKILKKHFKPVSTAERPVLEHLLYACCLSGDSHETADEAFAKLQEAYFDWNEVRVTTVSELAEVMSSLTKAAAAASMLKRTLQSVFETHYSFDLEFLKKENLGKAVKELEKLDGVGPFALAYVTQNGLGGHAIATCTGALEVMRILGIISDTEAAQQKVPGMERAISKSNGVEFGSMLHQLGIDYQAAPFSPRVRGILLEIAPDAKDRFPKRTSKKAVAAKTTKKDKDKSGKSSDKKKAPQKKVTAKKSAKTSTKTSKKSAAVTKKKTSSNRLTKKKPR
jgi:endonuclease III